MTGNYPDIWVSLQWKSGRHTNVTGTSPNLTARFARKSAETRCRNQLGVGSVAKIHLQTISSDATFHPTQVGRVSRRRVKCRWRRTESRPVVLQWQERVICSDCTFVPQRRAERNGDRQICFSTAAESSRGGLSFRRRAQLARAQTFGLDVESDKHPRFHRHCLRSAERPGARR